MSDGELYGLILEIRLCFNQLRSLADRLHGDLGINSSMRAVMEALWPQERRTVPAIARAKGVSRQHVQTIMNELQAAGLVEAADNPGHKRSPLFALSPKGRDLFRKVSDAELVPLTRLAASMRGQPVAEARQAIAHLNRLIEAEATKGDCDA